ncbi:MAG: hypothetical protein M3Q08_06855 [Pseudomonadota bacterium]|nr:hypothetical protein [Pseudomonadota bacterium]
MAMKFAKGASSPLDAAMAALAAGSVAFLIYAMPDRQFGAVVELSGLPRLISAAQPPLGTTARLAAVAAAALGTFLLVWAMLRGLGRKKPVRKAEPELEAEPQRKRKVGAIEIAPTPKIRRADAHPDAPAPRPIFAEHDFGEPAGAEHDSFLSFDEHGELTEEAITDEPPLGPIVRSFEPEGRRPIFEHLDLDEPAGAENELAAVETEAEANVPSLQAEAEDEPASLQEEPHYGTASEIADAPSELDPEHVSTAPWLPPVVEQLAEPAEAEDHAFEEGEDKFDTPTETAEEPLELGFENVPTETAEEPLELGFENVPAIVVRPTEAPNAAEASIPELVQRLEAALVRRKRKSWPVAEPARPGAAGAPRHIDQRLRSAIDDLQQLARRG